MAGHAATLPSPLTDADWRELNRHLALMNLILPDIDKAEAIGLDMLETRLRRDAVVRDLETVKREYFPNKR